MSDASAPARAVAVGDLHRLFRDAAQHPLAQRFPSPLLDTLRRQWNARALLVLLTAADERLHPADAAGAALELERDWSATLQGGLQASLQRHLRVGSCEHLQLTPLIRRGETVGVLASVGAHPLPQMQLELGTHCWALAHIETAVEQSWRPLHSRNETARIRTQAFGEMARGVAARLRQLLDLQESALNMLAAQTQFAENPLLMTLRYSMRDCSNWLTRLNEFSRLAGAYQALRPVRVEALLRLATQRLRREGTLIRLQFDPQFTLPANTTVLGEAEDLIRCVQELLKNAHDFGQQAPILVRWHQPEGAVMLEIHNQGVPLPPLAHQRVFELFYSTRPDPASGLGLPLAQAIASTHRGHVDLTTGPEGTSVFLTLPLQRPEPGARGRGLDEAQEAG